MTKHVAPKRPELSLPKEEGQAIRAAYEEANVILEYGSGGSTVMAAEMPDKLIFSVESDADWAVNLQHYLDTAQLHSRAIMHFVDIGKVGAWGRPVDSSEWHKFYHYPLGIWDEPFFRHPDVVLIDGRFRAACLAVVRLRITRPVTVLFDDYVERPLYHQVEKMVGTPKIVGRMAIFEIEPVVLNADHLAELMKFMTQATYVKGPRYAV